MTRYSIEFYANIIWFDYFKVKNLVTHLLEPDAIKRWKVDQVVESEWIGMDPRFKILSKAEENALSQAGIEKKSYIDGKDLQL